MDIERSLYLAKRYRDRHFLLIEIVIRYLSKVQTVQTMINIRRVAGMIIMRQSILYQRENERIQIRSTTLPQRTKLSQYRRIKMRRSDWTAAAADIPRMWTSSKFQSQIG